MKFLAGLLSTLLIPLIFSAILGFTLSKTLLNAEYMSEKAKTSGLYTDIATIIPEQIAANSVRSEDPKEKEKMNQLLTSVLTPGYLETKVDTFLKDFNNRYMGDGSAPIPEINLEELLVQARAQGVEVPEGDFQAKITIPTEQDAQIKAVFDKAKPAITGTVIGAVIAFLFLLLISIKIHSYWGIVWAFFVSALLQGLLFFVIKGSPVMLISYLEKSEASAAFIPIVEKFLGSITEDISNQFGVWALVFAVATIITFGFSMVSLFRRREAPVKKSTAEIKAAQAAAN
jgi:hypothetical protein